MLSKYAPILIFIDQMFLQSRAKISFAIMGPDPYQPVYTMAALPVLEDKIDSIGGYSINQKFTRKP